MGLALKAGDVRKAAHELGSPIFADCHGGRATNGLDFMQAL